MSPKVLQVGLIGFGLSGRYFHTPFLTVHPRFRIRTVMERSKNEARTFDPAIRSVRTAGELLDDRDIDLVFICTPNDSHYRYAEMALKQGKHVVIEKPFANTEVEARNLMTLAAQHNLVLTAYQNRRWDADFLTIRRILSEGLIGEIIEFESRFDRYRPLPAAESWKEKPAPGSGNLYNLGSHLIDQALTLFGAPDTVCADIRHTRPGSITDDYFDIRLGYADKSVRLKSSLMAFEHRLRFSLHGTTGSFIKGALDVQEETLRQNRLPDCADWGMEPEDRWGTLYTGSFTGKFRSEPGNYMAFYDNLYDAVVHGAAPAVKATEAVRTARVIDLAFESSRHKTILKF